MALVVQKFGGSSVAGAERIRRVAERVVAARRAGDDVVVVVSAMGDTTDELLELIPAPQNPAPTSDLAGQVAHAPSARELDVLLASGESVSSALLTMAIHALGAEACALSGWQAGVFTTSAYGRARIGFVLPTRVRHELDRGSIVVIAGFQGLCQDTQDVTTLGRGGSDTTAVAMAVALKADVCEIYTDVDGVYTADPRTVRTARRLDHISYEEMLALAAAGARVLMPRCVEYARRYGLALHVRSSLHAKRGTVVFGSVEDPTMEQELITGVAHDRSVCKIVVTGVPEPTAVVARIFRAVANAGVEIDMVARNTPPATDLAFTVPADGAVAVVAALRAGRADIGFEQVRSDERVGTVSLIGAGLRSHPGVTATFCEALTAAGTSIEIISGSELRISVLCRDHEVDDAVRALHDAFGLDLPAADRAGRRAAATATAATAMAGVRR